MFSNGEGSDQAEAIKLSKDSKSKTAIIWLNKSSLVPMHALINYEGALQLAYAGKL